MGMISPWKAGGGVEATPKKKDGGEAADVAAAAADDDGAEEGDAAEGSGGKDKGPGYFAKRAIYVVKAEQSMRERRTLTRGTASIHQVEMMHVVSTEALSLPERAGKHYEGSNKGTCLGPITLTPPADEWKATVKDKREIYGKRNRIAVGGRTEEGKQARRLESAVEPVCFHTMPLLFYEEVLHRFFGKSVFDLTPGAGVFGEACVKNRIGYFCIAMTERHAVELEERFRLAALRFMCEESSPIYNPKCAEAFGKTGTTTTPTPKPAAKAAGSKAAAAKPSPTPKPASPTPAPAAKQPAAKQESAPRKKARVEPTPTPKSGSGGQDPDEVSDWDFSPLDE